MVPACGKRSQRLEPSFFSNGKRSSTAFNRIHSRLLLDWQELWGSRKHAVAFFFVISSATWAANQSQFAIKKFHRDLNGVTFLTGTGTMRIEVCGDRVIHVFVSHTSEIPAPRVPVVTQPCKAENLQVDSGKNQVKLLTEAITVTVDTATGAVTFTSKDGKTVLAEPKNGGKAFDVPSVFETSIWQVKQSFSSPSDESLYGLGQHQEGIFNVRGLPIRLHQANTNISIPFLLSSKGYGNLWNNASLTDFNPADQTIVIDPTTGKGRFTTGSRGVYGFLLSSDNRNQLVVEVNGHHVIDLQNMWLPASSSARGEDKWKTQAEVFQSAADFQKEGGKLTRLEFPRTEIQRFGEVVISHYAARNENFVLVGGVKQRS